MKKEVKTGLAILMALLVSGLMSGCVGGMTHVPAPPTLQLEDPYTEYEGRLRAYRSRESDYTYYRMYMPDTGRWYACRKCKDVDPSLEDRCFQMYGFAFDYYKRDRERMGLPTLMRAGDGKTGVGGAVQCFAAETYVLMADGSFKAIEDVSVGDSVLSIDPETGSEKAGRVYDVMQGAEQYLFVLNQSLKVNSAHKFYTVDGLRTVPEMAAGDAVFSRGDRRTVVASVTMQGVLLASNEEARPEVSVYNFMVEDTHTFLVSPDKVNLYLVHDQCACAGD